MKRTCVKCGSEFELLPKKAGLSTHCPACSPPPPLPPREAHEAHLAERDQKIEVLYRQAIESGNQEEIEKWNRLRKTPFMPATRTNLSN
jgi:hypothetical protein